MMKASKDQKIAAFGISHKFNAGAAAGCDLL